MISWLATLKWTSEAAVNRRLPLSATALGLFGGSSTSAYVGVFTHIRTRDWITDHSEIAQRRLMTNPQGFRRKTQARPHQRRSFRTSRCGLPLAGEVENRTMPIRPG